MGSAGADADGLDLRSIRCVVWDLDETVWEGVLSEGGGTAVRAGVRELLELLQQHGIFHTIASRNEMAEAQAALDTHGLNRYFVLPQISWCAKSASVRHITQSLRLRSESLCLIDDSAFERDEVRSAFPDIQVMDSVYVEKLLSRCRKEGMLMPAISEEARGRPGLYMEEARRIKEREDFEGSDAQFLAQCGLELRVVRASEEDVPRIEELLRRSRQLNATGAVFAAEELHAMLANPECTVLVGSVSDRYGSYGRAAVMIGRSIGRESMEILSFAVSCRVLGKGIAQAFLAFVCSFSARLGLRALECEFRRTPHNRAVIVLFGMNGFALAKKNGREAYTIDLQASSVKALDWVSVSEKAA